MSSRRPAKPETRGPARMLDDPKPGFFKTRLVKGGPFVTAEIRHGPALDEDGAPLDRSYLWEAIKNGKHVRAPHPEPMRAGVFLVWHSATPIDEATFRFMRANESHAESYRPHDPLSTPDRRADVKRFSSEYFRLAKGS